jgi:23S rRNA (uracil1939-C5)-methyltransferase
MREARARAGGRATRLEVSVRALDDAGAALARAVDERVAAEDTRNIVIAAGAVPGDRLEVAVEREGRNERFARVLRVLEPSPERVTPRCAIVAECGGCPWQAVAYATQLRWKRDALVRAVRSSPALRDVEVGEVRALEDPYGYRTKIQMPVRGRAGALAVGFFRPHSHDLIDVADCPVQNPEGNRIVREAKAILDRARVEPYDEARHEGVLRYILLRTDGSGNKAALTLVARTDRFPSRDKVGERLGAIEGVSGVFLNVQPARGNVVLGRRTERLAGRDRVLVRVAGRAFLLSPTAFFQTNAAGAEALVERVRARLAGPFRTVVDLYCGAGLFARCLADRAQRVIGVEESHAAIADAEAGAALERTENVAFVTAPAELWAARDATAADAVVVDPPRAGCDPRLLEAIATRLKPRAIAYVSCFPPTLLRDLELLARAGYRTTAIDPVDMFPHTPHLECVAAVERSGSQ